MCSIYLICFCLFAIAVMQDNFEFVRSFGSLISFVYTCDFFGVVISVCDEVAGYFIFMISCSVFVVSAWNFMYLVVESLCSMHHLVGLSPGAFHRRLQYQVRFGYLCF